MNLKQAKKLRKAIKQIMADSDRPVAPAGYNPQRFFVDSITGAKWTQPMTVATGSFRDFYRGAKRHGKKGRSI